MNGDLYAREIELLNCKYVAEQIRRETIERENYWAVILGLVPKRDGNQWFVLFGDDLQSGVSGWGDTPEDAIVDFDRAMKVPAK